MGRSVLFQPHYDDAVLFASYTILDEHPKVVTVLGGETAQPLPINGEVRQRENLQALVTLGCDWVEDWPFSEVNPNWDLVEDRLSQWQSKWKPEVVWAPLSENGGHEQHNMVCNLVIAQFGIERCRFYATYQRGSGRSRTEMIKVPQESWPARKFAAMACYTTQINLLATRPWFASDDCLREWIA